jgi:protein SCO1
MRIIPFRIAFVMASLASTLLTGNRAMAGDAPYKRSIETYTVPAVTLTDQDGAKVQLQDLVQSQDPVLVQFVFANCTTICPVLSSDFANLQNMPGAEARNLHLISISIDPENDSPAVMKAYLKRYHAKPGWTFLTGSRADITQVMKSFSAFVPNKMNHFPLTFIRMPRSGQWVRLTGLLSSTALWKECEEAQAEATAGL